MVRSSTTFFERNFFWNASDRIWTCCCIIASVLAMAREEKSGLSAARRLEWMACSTVPNPIAEVK